MFVLLSKLYLGGTSVYRQCLYTEENIMEELTPEIAEPTSVMLGLVMRLFMLVGFSYNPAAHVHACSVRER